MENFRKMKKSDLVAMLEEIYVCDSPKVTSPKDISVIMRAKIGRSKQENFLVAYLDGANNIIDLQVIFKGTLNQCPVHPREVFAPAFELRAAAIIIGHNHPSGNIEPSFQDIDMTEKLKNAGEILGIQILDHVIFTKKGYYSFKSNGKI